MMRQHQNTVLTALEHVKNKQARLSIVSVGLHEIGKQENIYMLSVTLANTQGGTYTVRHTAGHRWTFAFLATLKQMDLSYTTLNLDGLPQAFKDIFHRQACTQFMAGIKSATPM